MRAFALVLEGEGAPGVLDVAAATDLLEQHVALLREALGNLGVHVLEFGLEVEPVDWLLVPGSLLGSAFADALEQVGFKASRGW